MKKCELKEEFKKNKKTILIVGGTVLTVVVVILVINVFFVKKPVNRGSDIDVTQNFTKEIDVNDIDPEKLEKIKEIREKKELPSRGTRPDMK